MHSMRINPKKKKRYRPYSPSLVNEFVKNTSESNIPQSTRRLFFTFAENSIEERGFYQVDQVGGMGSGILLLYRSKYFLLTAYHVVSDILKYQQNESPFFLKARNKNPTPEFQLEYLLFPRWHWDIRTLMPDSGGDVAWNDVALIELFDPLCHIPENEIVDLANVGVLNRKEFFDGQLLIGSGFPTVFNDYQYGGDDEFGPGMPQLTKIQRHHATGSLVRGEGPNDFYFKPSDPNIGHDSLNGMSGGSLVNIYHKSRKTRWAGMLKAVNTLTNLVQFIPAYAILPILHRYAESKRYNLDPNAGNPFVGLTPQKREEIQQFMRYVASMR